MKKVEFRDAGAASNQVAGISQDLSSQLRMAGLVQRDFLPKTLPRDGQLEWSASFTPAEWVSGDIYDIARLDEHHIGFYVADVVGHGMPAALLTMFLKQAMVMRSTSGNSYQIFSPSEVLLNLNDRMAQQQLSGYQFASCCYCLLNTELMQVVYARAGHPHPILIRPGVPPRQLEVPGHLLGVFNQASYTNGVVQLQSGDKLLLYTDGADRVIGDFDRTSGFSFSDGFLEISSLPAVELVEAFDALAVEQGRRTGIIDDITAVCLEVR